MDELAEQRWQYPGKTIGYAALDETQPHGTLHSSRTSGAGVAGEPVRHTSGEAADLEGALEAVLNQHLGGGLGGDAAPGSGAAVVLQNIRKSYGQQQALKGVSLTMRQVSRCLSRWFLCMPCKQRSASQLSNADGNRAANVLILGQARHMRKAQQALGAEWMLVLAVV